MHLSDGVLSLPVLLGGVGGAVVGTAIGLRRIDDEQIPKVAVLTACLFVASLIHVPIGPSSVHLVLNGVVGMLIGWAVFPSILIASFLQALFFGFGGVAVLGANTCILALPAVLCGGLGRLMLKKSRSLAFTSMIAFVVSAGAIFISALLAAFALSLGDVRLVSVAQVLVVAHVPVMIVEGFIGAGVSVYLAKVRPETFSLKPEFA